MTKATQAATAPTTVSLSEVATLDGVLTAQVIGIVRQARFTNYKTGSDGFRLTGKCVNEHGVRYQLTGNLIRIHSADIPAV